MTPALPCLLHLPLCQPAKAAWCLRGSACRNGGHHYTEKCCLFTVLQQSCSVLITSGFHVVKRLIEAYGSGSIELENFSDIFFSSSCWRVVLWGRPWTYHPNRRVLKVLELPWIFIDTDHACLQHVLTSAWGTVKPLSLAHFLSVLQILVQNYKSCRWKGHLDWTYQEKLSLFGKAKSCSTGTVHVLCFQSSLQQCSVLFLV